MIGRRWYASALFAALAASPPTGVAVPSSPPPATADPCATAIPDLPNDLPTAFAYDLTSAPLLRLLTAIAALGPRDQRRAFDAAADAAEAPDERAAAAAVAALCPNLDEVYATTRALAFVSNRWKLAELSDSKRFAAFGAVAETALWALTDADRLPPETLRAALAPFADLGALATPAPQPSVSSSSTCAQPDVDPRTVREVAADYPDAAYYSATAGTVLVKVLLSETGAVRYARIVSNTLRRGPGSELIIREAIFAAAASTYAPGTHGCNPAPSEYFAEFLFRPRLLQR